MLGRRSRAEPGRALRHVHYAQCGHSLAWRSLHLAVRVEPFPVNHLHLHEIHSSRPGACTQRKSHREGSKCLRVVTSGYVPSDHRSPLTAGLQLKDGSTSVTHTARRSRTQFFGKASNPMIGFCSLRLSLSVRQMAPTLKSRLWSVCKSSCPALWRLQLVDTPAYRKRTWLQGIPRAIQTVTSTGATDWVGADVRSVDRRHRSFVRPH